MTVKIDRSSIKKNPNAGRTSFLTFGPGKFTGVINGDIPEHLKDHLIPQSQEKVNGVVTRTDFVVIENHSQAAKMLKDAGIQFTFNTEVTNHHSIHPDPKYLFKYEDPLITCSECLQELPVSEVINVYDDDDWNNYTECPKCHKFNTFEVIEYEDIEEVINTNTEQKEGEL